MRPVTDEQFWREVGRALRDIREAKGWHNVIDVQHAGNGAPNWESVQMHERGTVKTVRVLTDHTKALGVSVSDVFASVLSKTTANGPLSPEAGTLLRQFEQMTVPHRRHVSELVEMLFDTEGHQSEPVSAPGPVGRAPRRK